MPQDISKDAERTALELINHLKHFNYSTTPLVKKQYHFEFDTSVDKEKVKVLVYFGKKGIKTVIQGNPNSDLYKEIETIINVDAAGEEKIDEYKNYIGSDETGKGDFFGPLVTCAVYVNEKLIVELRKIGVKDSKELSDTKIKSIASQLKKIGNDFYEIISINPKRYNELYDKIRNINELLNWSHSKAIENLAGKFNTKTVITDKFRLKEMKFSKTFDASKYELIQIPKAEKYSAVAAASILARDKQLEWFDAQKRRGLNFPKGASDLVIAAAKKLIEEIGYNELENYAKMHFKTVNGL